MMEDITEVDEVEILIRDDGSVVWINTEKGCVLRICQIKHLTLNDCRSKKTRRI